MSNAVPSATANLRMRDVLAAIKRAMPIAGPGILVRQTSAGSIITNNAMGAGGAAKSKLLPFDVRMHRPEGEQSFRGEIYMPAGSYSAESAYTPINEKSVKYHEDDGGDWYDLGTMRWIASQSTTETLDDGTTIVKTPALVRVLALPGAVLVAESYWPEWDTDDYDYASDLSRCAYAALGVATVWRTVTTPSGGGSTTTSYSVEQTLDGAVHDSPPDNPAQFRLKYTLADNGTDGVYGKKVSTVEVENVRYQCGQYLVYGEEDSYEVESGDKESWLEISHPPANPQSNDPPRFELNVKTGNSTPTSTDTATNLHLYTFMSGTFGGSTAWFPIQAFDTRRDVLGVPFYS